MKVNKKALTTAVVVGTLVTGKDMVDLDLNKYLPHPITAEAATETITGTTTENLNLRKGAGTNHAVVKVLPKGQKLTILSQDGKWMKVKAGSKEGWVHSDWVKVDKASSSKNTSNNNNSTNSNNTNASTSTRTGTTTESLNLRKGAGTNHGVIKVLPKGQSLTILSQDGTWMKVKAGSSEGWVHSGYVKVTNTSSSSSSSNKNNSSSSNNTNSSTRTGTTTESLNLRKGAGTNHGVVKVLPKGQSLTILSQDGTWMKVKAGSSEGWVHSGYVKVTNTSSSSSSSNKKNSSSSNNTNSSTRTGTTTESLNLRKGAGTNHGVVKVLPKGQSLTILSQDGTWMKVKAGSLEGWVHSGYVKVSNGSTSTPVNGQKENYETRIGSATSTYPTSQVDRSHNVELAASRVNGTVIKPGESFSFTKLVGPVTTKSGYRNATVFQGGQYSEGIGGGMCQVSSTIYYAQLRTGILPTERRNHSLAVGYVPLGLDATMWEGSIDYRFKNTLDYPIYLEVTAKNGNLTVNFWSDSKALNGYTYEPRTERVGKTSTTETYKTYLQTYKDGKFVSERYLDQSTYKMK